MSPSGALLEQLLAHAAGGPALAPCSGRFGWRPEGDDLRQFQWVLEGGLGPLLHHAMGAGGEWLPPEWRQTLLAADLTSRVRHGAAIDTLMDVLDVGERLGVEVTLLKGISVSEQWYPKEHLRPMGDIDVLIPAAEYGRFEAELLALGCEQVDEPHVEGRQHGIPLRHVRRDVFIELHTALFQSNSPFFENSLFGIANVASQSRPSHYHGRPVKRLSPELQLAYIASSWFNDLTMRRVHPSFLASLFDAVYLLRAVGPGLDWRDMLGWLDNDMAKASVYVLASYLPRHGVEPLDPAFLAHLAASQDMVGPVQLKLIHNMLDKHLIAGRPWDSALPPPVPGRYSLPYQFRKRVLSRHSMPR